MITEAIKKAEKQAIERRTDLPFPFFIERKTPSPKSLVSSKSSSLFSNLSSDEETECTDKTWVYTEPATWRSSGPRTSMDSRSDSDSDCDSDESSDESSDEEEMNYKVGM